MSLETQLPLDVIVVLMEMLNFHDMLSFRATCRRLYAISKLANKHWIFWGSRFDAAPSTLYEAGPYRWVMLMCHHLRSYEGVLAESKWRRFGSRFFKLYEPTIRAERRLDERIIDQYRDEHAGHCSACDEHRGL